VPRGPRSRSSADLADLLLFRVDESPAAEQPQIKHPARAPVWSYAKARLIADYLRLFIMVTRHGTYIDGFAGPQVDETGWSARRVLEIEPTWLRHFHLCDVDPDAVAALEALAVVHRSAEREVVVYGPGDFNLLVDRILDPALIGRREATFCLLDQRTFQCHWETVTKLARFKATGYKIELFYFLANGWLDRSLAESSSVEGKARIARWWGNEHWTVLRGAHHVYRARRVACRFVDELGYRYSEPWPIYDHDRRVMYYMIHATDHPDAPDLMGRAYASAVCQPPLSSQLDLFGGFALG
jgi:three-Cys-motif partner protein